MSADSHCAWCNKAADPKTCGMIYCPYRLKEKAVKLNKPGKI